MRQKMDNWQRIDSVIRWANMTINYFALYIGLPRKLDRKQVGIDPSLHLRFCEFRVIGLLANDGRKATEPYIEETDRLYRQHPKSSTPEAWFGYKITVSYTHLRVQSS